MYLQTKPTLPLCSMVIIKLLLCCKLFEAATKKKLPTTTTTTKTFSFRWVFNSGNWAMGDNIYFRLRFVIGTISHSHNVFEIKIVFVAQLALFDIIWAYVHWSIQELLLFSFHWCAVTWINEYYYLKKTYTRIISEIVSILFCRRRMSDKHAQMAKTFKSDDLFFMLRSQSMTFILM